MAKQQTYEAKATDGSGVVIQFTASADATPEQLQIIAERLFEIEQKSKKTGKLPGFEMGAKPAPAAEPPVELPAEALPPGRMEQYKEAAKQELESSGVNPAGAIGAGAGLAASVMEARNKGPATALEKLGGGFKQGLQRAPSAPPVAPPVTPPAGPSILGPSGTPMAPPRGAPGTTPGGAPTRSPMGGSATQNYGKVFGLTDIEAQRATDMTKQAGGVHDLTTKRREALNLLQERFPSDRFIENPRYGGLMTPEPSVGGGPRAQYVQPQGAPQAPLRPLPAPQAIPTGPKPMGALEEVTQLFRKMAEGGSKVASGIGGAARALPVISYPLAGYSMGQDYGAIQEELAKESPDYADIALRGIGALGTGLSLHPFTAPVGLPMATMAPLIAAGRRKMRETPQMPDATYQELVEASRPSFRISRP